MLQQGNLNRVVHSLAIITVGTILIFCGLVQSHIKDIYLDMYLDRCMDALHHKAKPGPEDGLFKQVKIFELMSNMGHRRLGKLG